MNPLILAGVLETGIHLASLLPFGYLPFWLPLFQSPAGLTAYLVALVFFYPAWQLFLVGLVLRALPKETQDGIALPDRGTQASGDALWWIVRLSLTTIPYRSPSRWAITVMPFPGWVYYRLAGARIQLPVSIPPHVVLYDLHRIEIGARTILGDGVKISPHAVLEPGVLRVGDVRIGEDVVVGGDSLLGPDVEIADGATILARSALIPGTRVGPGEIWGGSPARPVRRKAPKS